MQTIAYMIYFLSKRLLMVNYLLYVVFQILVIFLVHKIKKLKNIYYIVLTSWIIC
jgi:hypothetical protein